MRYAEEERWSRNEKNHRDASMCVRREFNIWIVCRAFSMCHLRLGFRFIFVDLLRQNVLVHSSRSIRCCSIPRSLSLPRCLNQILLFNISTHCFVFRCGLCGGGGLRRKLQSIAFWIKRGPTVHTDKLSCVDCWVAMQQCDWVVCRRIRENKRMDSVSERTTTNSKRPQLGSMRSAYVCVSFNFGMLWLMPDLMIYFFHETNYRQNSVQRRILVALLVLHLEK